MPTPQQTAWLKSMVAAAQTTARQWGVPASVTLAQCVLESGWGTSQLSREAHNFFGIKCVPGQDYAAYPTQEVVNGHPITEIARFARYGTVVDCFAAHAHLLAGTPRYRAAMAAAQDVPEFCSQLQLCGYSTNPKYAMTLLGLIQQLGLQQYDIPAQAAPAPVEVRS